MTAAGLQIGCYICTKCIIIMMYVCMYCKSESVM